MTPGMEQPEPIRGRQNIAGERDFHNKRFARMARQYKPGLVARAINSDLKTSQDFMLEEAHLEKADRERRESEEARAWEKNLKPVLEDILAIRDHKEGSEQLNAMIIASGGGMAKR